MVPPQQNYDATLDEIEHHIERLIANWLPLGTVPVGLLQTYDQADARSLVVDDRHVVGAEKIVERLQDQGLKILVGLQLHHA